MQPVNDPTAFPNENPYASGQVSVSEPVRQARQAKFEQAKRAQAMFHQIETEAQELIKQGVPCDTIFFRFLPVEVSQDHALRMLMGPHIKTIEKEYKNNSANAWIVYHNHENAKQSLHNARVNYPTWNVYFHDKPGLPFSFEAKAESIRQRGGLANSILLRNIRSQVTENEIKDIISSHVHPHPVLQVRGGKVKGKGFRLFWVVFENYEICIEACRMLRGLFVTFNCGQKMRLIFTIHDDSRDQDASNRRKRSQAMGSQKTRAKTQITPDQVSPLDRLEQLLKTQPNDLLFLAPSCPMPHLYKPADESKSQR